MAVATNWFDSHSFFVFIFNNEKILRLEVV